MTKIATPSPMDDQTLIDRCIQGDRDSREVLARECLPFVRKLVCLGYGNHSDTEDVIQKSLVVVFRDLGELRNPGAFRSWMYRVTTNVIATHGGRRTRWLSLFSLDPFLDEREVSLAESPEQETLRTLLFDRLSLHLEKLKQKKRMAIVLSLFFGYVDSEIGVIMGCSAETAKKRVQHGRRELVKAVKRDPGCRELMKGVAI